jgi:hypothetical protein
MNQSVNATSVFEGELDQPEVDDLLLATERDAGVPKMSLQEFIGEFGQGLLEAVERECPPVYQGNKPAHRDAVLQQLKRKPFDAQREVVHAATALLLDRNQPACVLNCDMGTGKTMISICIASVLYQAGYRRMLVLSPPHLVYKWRREILDTVPGATVWVLNGPETLAKLLMLREALGVVPKGPEFFILGRVRMRMGFHWRPAFVVRRQLEEPFEGARAKGIPYNLREIASCPDCLTPIVMDESGLPASPGAVEAADRRLVCPSCKGRMWTLQRPKARKSRRELVLDTVTQLPTIGPKTANRLMDLFGEDLLGDMLADNVYAFINLMDDQGNLVFSDRQARRMEKTLGSMELSFGDGHYQATEFIKRYLPDQTFDLLIVDEGHEYKSPDSAQGIAMGVLAAKARKTLLLTGTLMAGYADDLFFLLWRIMTRNMLEDGYRYNSRGTLGTASTAWMRQHGVLKDVVKVTEGGDHRTARGKRVSVRTVKAPGFGPKGIARYVLPYTCFLKLKDIGQDVLPPYEEIFHEVAMTSAMDAVYSKMSSTLSDHLKKALRCGDHTLMGVVLNALLAWPECCFRPENITHPRDRRNTLHFNAALFADAEPTPKEQVLIDLCREERSQGRRVLAYTVYTGTRDTSQRLKALLTQEGFRVAVLKSTVPTEKREDWIIDQVERGCDVLITNPELVKTGLDLLDFPTIAFLQTGYNVYTLQQAAKRSWRIGQKEAVRVFFFGYIGTAQIQCLRLMAKKIAVSQSTSGEMPESGLEILNQEDDSIEMALARQLISV